MILINIDLNKKTLLSYNFFREIIFILFFVLKYFLTENIHDFIVVKFFKNK